MWSSSPPTPSARRNQGVTVSEAITAWSRIASRARAAGLRTTITVAAAFGCPFEGEVAPERVAEVLNQCVQAQPDEVALADTIGVGVPAAVRARPTWPPTSRPVSRCAGTSITPVTRATPTPSPPSSAARRRSTPARRDRRLPVRPRRHRQHRHRGPALPPAPVRRAHRGIRRRASGGHRAADRRAAQPRARAAHPGLPVPRQPTVKLPQRPVPSTGSSSCLSPLGAVFAE